MKKLSFLVILMLLLSCATDELVPTRFSVKIGNTTLPVAYEGQEYYHKFSIRGDARSYDWSCDLLPNGLSIKDGIISGTPAVDTSNNSPYSVSIWADNTEDPNWLVVGNAYIIIVISGEPPPPPPVADFTGTPTSGIIPLTVNFTDTSSGNITSWSWDFDNDSVEDSNLQNPSNIYSILGIYTVSLTVTGSGGSDTETKVNYITVNNVPQNWQIEILDSGGSTLGYTTLLIDDLGYKHISYMFIGCSLRYAYWNGLSWMIEILEASDCVQPNMALDSNNYPHIIYKHSSLNRLRYKYFDGIFWQSETINTTNPVNYPKILLDSNDYPHIVYRDQTSVDLMYLRWDGLNWISESLSGISEHIAMALDFNNCLHVVSYHYLDNWLYYRYFDGTSWQHEYWSQSKIAGECVALKLDSSGYPHIVYYNPVGVKLMYLYWTGLVWVSKLVSNSGYHPSLRLDFNDYPHISYLKDDSDDLYYTYYDGSWNTEIIDSDGSVGQHNSIYLFNGHIHVAYMDITNVSLKYAYK
jgi:PKD repeat protein